jgi:A/G-specific adenine glycosylase
MKRDSNLTPQQIRKFQRTVYDHYRINGRILPWRKTEDPYAILVSEIMLQQTQVARVLDKYETFMNIFPDIESLAEAPLRKVLHTWQGLGYNRRALFLKRCAEQVVSMFQGIIPSDMRKLTELQGIGAATAGAICAYAFNQPVVYIETNIRTVYIHHFFNNAKQVSDGDIKPLVSDTLDRNSPRRWYNALMDYGGELKRLHSNPSRKSAHYQKQSRFEGSNRQVRGAILKVMTTAERLSHDDLLNSLPFDRETIEENIIRLTAEGLIATEGETLVIT